MVMVDSMKRANSVESAKFLPEIGKSDYQGVTTKIQFDDKGDLKGGAISLYQVKDGKWEYRETIGGSVVAEVKEAVKEAATAVKDAAVATGDAAKEAMKDAAKEGSKVAAEVSKDAAAAKAAVEKK